MVRLVEEGDRRAAAAGPPIRRRIGHAVQGRDPAVVGPLRHEVAEVDDEGIGHRLDIAPRPVATAHLQAAGARRRQKDREAAVIAVRARAQLAGQGRASRLGIVVEAHGCDVAVDLVGEEFFRHSERQREDAHEPLGEALHRAVVNTEPVLESRAAGSARCWARTRSRGAPCSRAPPAGRSARR